MRSASSPSHAPTETVLLRVAEAIERAALRLALLETALSDDEGVREELQAFDSIGQELRALAQFLSVASAKAEGEVGLSDALGSVWLEQLRAQLAGETAKAAALEPEFW